jgi:ABC-type sugar transport system ATPase subunit
VDQAARVGGSQQELIGGIRADGLAAMPPAVALSQVAISFRLADGGSYAAVDRTSLAVADGEFVAIVGPTGCGKTTLLNVAAGLIAPSTGRVEIFGAPLAGLNRQAGYLFQAEALFPWKTALENVAIGLETAGIGLARPRGGAGGLLSPLARKRASGRGPGLPASASPSSARAIRTCSRAAKGSASASSRCSSAIRKSC